MDADAQAAAGHAAKLLGQHGPHRAWFLVTEAAISWHLAGAADQYRHWSAVAEGLRRSGPLPGPAQVDIERSARVLLATRSAGAAWRHAMDLAAGLAAAGDLVGEVAFLRVADAVNATVEGGPSQAV